MKKNFVSHISLKRLRLFSFLLVTVFANACIKDPEGLGGSILPQTDLIEALQTDTITLKTKLVWMDSVRTDRQSGNTSVLIGSMVDNQFGLTSCAANIQFDRLNTLDTVPQLSQIVAIDSVILDLAVPVFPYSYGDRVDQRYRVELLTEQLSHETNYFGFSSVGHEDENLVVDQRKQSSYATYVEDGTSKSVLRLKLAPELGTKVMEAIELGETTEGFRAIFKGLRIAMDQSSGAITRYDLNSKLSQMRVYYTYQPTGSKTEELEEVIELGIIAERDGIAASEYFTETNKQFLQSPLEGIQNSLELGTNSALWLQAGFVACEVDYSGVVNLLNQDHLTINNVDLVVPVLSGDDKSRALPSALITIAKLDLVKGFYGTLPNSWSVFSKYPYNIALNQYQLNVTEMVRGYQTELLSEPKFYIAASNSDRAVNTVVLAGPANDALDRYQNMRMVLTYTTRIAE